MKKQNNSREGGGEDGKYSGNDRGKDKVEDNIHVVKKTQNEKRVQRIVLKSNPKPASRITLRGKGKEEETSVVKANRQRSAEGSSSKPSGSPHTSLRSRAGKSSPTRKDSVPDFSAYKTRYPPDTNLHPSKFAERSREAAAASTRSPALRNRGNMAPSRQDEGARHLTQRASTLHARESHHDSIVSPRSLEPTENDKAQFEHLSEISQATRSNSFLVKVIPDRTLTHEDEAYDWELVGYPRPSTPIPISIIPSATSMKVHVAAQQSKQMTEPGILEPDLWSPPTRPTGNDKKVSKTISSCKSGESMRSTQTEGQREQDLESKIRSILTQSNRGQHRRSDKSHDSVKSVRWDPSIVSLGPKTSPATTVAEPKAKPSEATAGSTKSLEERLKAFTKTIKGLKKGDKQVLAQLLEALRNVESDDESSEVTVQEAINSESNVQALQETINTEQGVGNQDSRWNDIISKAVATKDQKSYREALTAGLIQSTTTKQSKTRERSKSESTEQTLVGSDETSIQVKTAPSFREVKKLNPLAPVFHGFTETKRRATQSDPVVETQSFISRLRKQHQSCDENLAPKPEVRVAPKAEKYVPPALRERNAFSPDKQSQEPIWIKIHSEQSPKKSAEPSRERIPSFEKPISFDKEYEEYPNLASEVSEFDRQLQAEWIRQWLHDAAKPDHGLETDHPPELQHLLQGAQACNTTYEHPIEDVAMSTQMYEHNTMPFGGVPLVPPPGLGWPLVNQNILQQPNLGSGYPLWHPVVGPLFPVPPPPFLFGHTLWQDPTSRQLPTPLIPMPTTDVPATPRMRFSAMEKPGRVANTLNPMWRDQILDRFVSKFPLTGKCQFNFPVPPVQDLDTKPAQIQQKLELLLLQEKEKEAFKQRFGGMPHKNLNGGTATLSSSRSENLIKLD